MISFATLSDDPSVEAPEEFDPGAFGNPIFRMYPGDQICDVTLECRNEIMMNIIDRFGKPKNIKAFDDQHFQCDVTASISTTFFGWIAQFVGKLRIIAPEDVKKKYADFGKQIYDEQQ